MAIRPDKIDRLKSTLLTSGLSQQNQSLFQVINSLIDALKELITESNASSGGGGGVVNNFTTVENKFLNPLNSFLYGDSNAFPRYVLVGSNNSDALDQDFVVLSDGGTPIPEPVNDGAGNFIYVAYTP